MSASRIRLLAAAIVASVLTPAAPCWAQAYGAKSVVDNNDLRWFEPVEFDLDGSAPRSRAGWNFSVEKLGWAITGERIEVGAPGIVNPSEQIYLPNPDIAVQSQVNQIALAQGFGRAGNSAADDQLILDQITQLLNVSFTGGTVTTATVIDDTFDDPSAMDGDNPRFFEAPEITPGSGFNAPPLSGTFMPGVYQVAAFFDFESQDFGEINDPVFLPPTDSRVWSFELEVEGLGAALAPFEPCSIADLAPPFGELDISDVVEFLRAFGTSDPVADLAPPFGEWDISDVVEFLRVFGAGCP